MLLQFGLLNCPPPWRDLWTELRGVIGPASAGGIFPQYFPKQVVLGFFGRNCPEIVLKPDSFLPLFFAFWGLLNRFPELPVIFG